MTRLEPFRLLVDPPHDGVANMARDEALLTLVGDGSSPPTLRFYRWDPPTISLGYFQRFAEFEALPPPAGKLALVRRTTGGGAILHDREWTYSLTLPAAHPALHGGASSLYELVDTALIDSLALLNVHATSCRAGDGSTAARGPFFCFERRHCSDVLLGDQKLAGSAQRRTRQAVLQHGSIILANRFAQHKVAALSDQLNLHDDDLLDPMCEALERRMGMKLERGEWRPQELNLTGELKVKYGSSDWTRRFP